MADKNVKILISATDQTSGALASAERGFKSLKDSVFSLQGAIGAVGLSSAIMSSVNAAKEAEAANIGLAVSARYAGESIDATLAAAQSLTNDGLMTMSEASKGLQNLLSRGFGLEEAITLMNRFKDSAAFNRQASLGFGEAIVSATEGLKNENSILVDNAGVTKNVSVMWAEYAAQIGKGAMSLSQAEKRQAEFNGILRETNGQVGNAALSTETLAGQQAKLAAETKKAQISFGQALTPAMIDAFEVITPLIGLLGDFVGGLQMMAVETAAFVDKINIIGGIDWGNVIFGGDTFAEAQERIKREFAAINQAVEEQKAEIVRKQTAPTAPTIGRDTGNRRKDVVIPAGQTAEEKASDKEAIEAATFDAIALQRAYQDELLKIEEDTRITQMKNDAEWMEYQNKKAIENYNNNLTWDKLTYEAKLQAAQGYASAYGQIFDAINTLTNGKFKAIFVAQRAMAASQAVISGLSAAGAAVQHPPVGLGPVAGAPLAVAMKAAGFLNAAAIMQQAITGPKSGGGGSLAFGGGTPTSPVVTTGVTGATAPTSNVTVVIEGNIIGEDEYVETRLVPAIERITRRNVTIRG